MKAIESMTNEELQLELEECVYSEMTSRYNKSRRSYKAAKNQILEELKSRGIDAEARVESIRKQIETDLSEGHGNEVVRVAPDHGKTKIMYIELKSGFGDNGPARIGRVTYSKSGRTVYYQGKAFQSLKGRGVSGNYFDIDTGEEYWISGTKKDGTDRHWAGSGVIEIDDDVREEYFEKVLSRCK